MQNPYKSESGRSMVEIIALIVLLALLLIVGLWGFKTAVLSSKVNTITKDMSNAITERRYQIAQGGTSKPHTLNSNVGSTQMTVENITSGLDRGEFTVLLSQQSKDICEEIKKYNIFTPEKIEINGSITNDCIAMNSLKFYFDPQKNGNGGNGGNGGGDDPLGGLKCPAGNVTSCSSGEYKDLYKTLSDGKECYKCETCPSATCPENCTCSTNPVTGCPTASATSCTCPEGYSTTACVSGNTYEIDSNPLGDGVTVCHKCEDCPSNDPTPSDTSCWTQQDKTDTPAGCLVAKTWVKKEPGTSCGECGTCDATGYCNDREKTIETFYHIVDGVCTYSAVPYCPGEKPETCTPPVCTPNASCGECGTGTCTNGTCSGGTKQLFDGMYKVNGGTCMHVNGLYCPNQMQACTLCTTPTCPDGCTCTDGTDANGCPTKTATMCTCSEGYSKTTCVNGTNYQTATQTLADGSICYQCTTCPSDETIPTNACYDSHINTGINGCPNYTTYTTKACTCPKLYKKSDGKGDVVTECCPATHTLTTTSNLGTTEKGYQEGSKTQEGCCPNDRVYTQRNKKKCCASNAKSYNNGTACCTGSVYANGTKCCAGTVYDNDTKCCASGSIISNNHCCPNGSSWSTTENACVATVTLDKICDPLPQGGGSFGNKYVCIRMTFPSQITSGSWQIIGSDTKAKMSAGNNNVTVWTGRTRVPCSASSDSFTLTNNTIHLSSGSVSGFTKTSTCYGAGWGRYYTKSSNKMVIEYIRNPYGSSSSTVYTPSIQVKYIN